MWTIKAQAAIFAGLENYALHKCDYKAFDTVLPGYLRSLTGERSAWEEIGHAQRLTNRSGRSGG